MSDIMRPIPFSQLMNWVIEEHKTQDAIFGVRKMVTTNQGARFPFLTSASRPRLARLPVPIRSWPRTSWHPTWPVLVSLSSRSFR